MVVIQRPAAEKPQSWQQWVDAADAYWRASTDTSDGGLGIPLLWGTDAVHGHNNLQMAVIFPHNSALGAAADTDLMRRIGEVTAYEVKATALDWVFAPTLAVARDDRWGRAYESYSEDQTSFPIWAQQFCEAYKGRPIVIISSAINASSPLPSILSAMAARNMALIRATLLAVLVTSKKSTPIPIAPPLIIRCKL